VISRITNYWNSLKFKKDYFEFSKATLLRIERSFSKSKLDARIRFLKVDDCVENSICLVNLDADNLYIKISQILNSSREINVYAFYRSDLEDDNYFLNLFNLVDVSKDVSVKILGHMDPSFKVKLVKFAFRINLNLVFLS